MTKRQARLFAMVGTGLAVLAFLGMTIDSHRQFPRLTHSENITPAVVSGMDVWHRNNCINCHTLFGEGAYFAPDLTKIAQQRGEPYLRAYMKDPSKFYNEQRHRRLMPTPNLTDQEIGELIAFLDWVSKVDNQNWPPRPILVSGASIPGTDLTLAQQRGAGGPPPGAAPVGAEDDPAALGEQVFRSAVPACNTCHSIAAGVSLVGPSLAGVGTRAAQRIRAPDYTGKAADAEGYIRESILEPSAYRVPGAAYSANGVSFMPTGYAQTLKPEQVDQLVAYLMSLR